MNCKKTERKNVKSEEKANQWEEPKKTIFYFAFSTIYRNFAILIRSQMSPYNDNYVNMRKLCRIR